MIEHNIRVGQLWSYGGAGEPTIELVLDATEDEIVVWQVFNGNAGEERIYIDDALYDINEGDFIMLEDVP